MLKVSNKISIPMREIELTGIRAQGAGGQNVNKVSSAIHLRFDVIHSSLPEVFKQRLLELGDYRISSSGVIVIKAQRYRTQEQNRADALQRLEDLIKRVMVTPKIRRATRATKSSQQKRLDSKVARGNIKRDRSKNWTD